MTTEQDVTWEHRARAAGLGLLMRPDGSTCPRSLVGLPCLTDVIENGELALCWCYSRLKQHAYAYIDPDDDQAVIMWEPYSTGGIELAVVLDRARADGLRVRLSGASPYNPGNTFAITFERKVSR